MKSLILSVLLISTSVFAGKKNFAGEYDPKDNYYCGWNVIDRGNDQLYLESTANRLMSTSSCSSTVLLSANCKGRICRIVETDEKIEFTPDGNKMIFNGKIVNYRLAQ